MKVVYHRRDGEPVEVSNVNPDVTAATVGRVFKRHPGRLKFRRRHSGEKVAFEYAEVTRIEIDLT